MRHSNSVDMEQNKAIQKKPRKHYYTADENRNRLQRGLLIILWSKNLIHSLIILLKFLPYLPRRCCCVCVGVCSKIEHAGRNRVKNEDHTSYATGRKWTWVSATQESLL